MEGHDSRLGLGKPDRVGNRVFVSAVHSDDEYDKPEGRSV